MQQIRILLQQLTLRKHPL